MEGIRRIMDLSVWRVGLSQFFCLILLLSISLTASAVEQAPSESVMVGERPSLNGEATIVNVGLFVFDIDEIDDV